MKLEHPEAVAVSNLVAGFYRFANQRLEVLPAFTDLEELKQGQFVALRKRALASPELIEAYAASCTPPAALPDAREIVASWKVHINGHFIILRHLKRHSIFLEQSDRGRAIGVVGLNQPIEALFPVVPTFVGAALLPFRDQIVHDGFILTPGPFITFGGGARRAMQDSYQQAKASHGGVVTTLVPRPGAPSAGSAEGDEHKLRELMRSERSRTANWGEIVRLRRARPELEAVYHEELGKAHARTIGKRLRDAGIASGWFAIFRGMVIASATSRGELQVRVGEILEPSDAHLPYLFQLKRKKE